MIHPADMIDQLMTLERLNLGSVKAGQAELWAEAINEQLPDVTPDQVRRAIIRLAGTRTTQARGVFLTPADLIEAVRGVTDQDKRDKAARLEAAKHEHGDFTIHPAITDPTEFLRYKSTVQHAFLDGATVEQATAAGWVAIGRTQPPPEITEHHEVPTRIGRAA